MVGKLSESVMSSVGKIMRAVAESAEKQDGSVIRCSSVALHGWADAYAQLEAERDLWKQRSTFAEAKRIAETEHDYGLAAYMLRDLQLTKTAELADLAHALHSETASKGDWNGLCALWEEAWQNALKAGEVGG